MPNSRWFFVFGPGSTRTEARYVFPSSFCSVTGSIDMRIPTVFSLFALVTATFSGAASAQDPRDEMYGKAVHAFFRGDVDHAELLLNDAIAAGTVDPRAYIFRGLCLSRNGIEAGTADFQKAADLEINGARKVVNVGQALQRIQGPVRAEIEKARLNARLAARARSQEMGKLGGGADGLVVPPKNDPAPAPSNLAPNDPFNAGMTKGDAKAMEGKPKN
ncbi:MAG: tetratricopeptide repeat protein, partial [Pirellula sp.]